MAKNTKAFAYKLGDRVTVPGTKLQGVVTLPRDYRLAAHKGTGTELMVFYVAWLTDDGSTADGWFAAPELQIAGVIPVEAPAAPSVPARRRA